MENRYQKKIITIPNILSFFRVLLIPVIVWAYVFRKDATLAVILLTVSGATDVVDGIIARKCNMISDFGKAFDPIADKLTQFSVLLCLVTRFHWMLLPASLMFVKEIGTGIINLLAIRRTGEVHGAVWHGKATTVALYCLMIVHLVWYDIPHMVSGILIGACTTMMVLSGILYAMYNLARLKKSKQSQ